HHLAYEMIDNAVDEALAGYATEINVTLYKDNSLSVRDNGRGIPTGKHDSGKATSEVIFTVLHAGGKFGQGSYKTSGGLHGVGAAVVNALSSWLYVEIERDGKKYEQRFENGGSVVEPLTYVKDTKNRGTFVRFKPDETIFTTSE